LRERLDFRDPLVLRAALDLRLLLERLLFFFCGTLAPFSRASLSPMAIACFRLRTFPPEPLLSVPCFRRRIADSTPFEADFPYFATPTSGYWGQSPESLRTRGLSPSCDITRPQPSRLGTRNLPSAVGG
jgi:hypothetical protein